MKSKLDDILENNLEYWVDGEHMANGHRVKFSTVKAKQAISDLVDEIIGENMPLAISWRKGLEHNAVNMRLNSQRARKKKLL